MSNCEDAPWVTKHKIKYHKNRSNVNREKEGINSSVKETRLGEDKYSQYMLIDELNVINKFSMYFVIF